MKKTKTAAISKIKMGVHGKCGRFNSLIFFYLLKWVIILVVGRTFMFTQWIIHTRKSYKIKS